MGLTPIAEALASVLEDAGPLPAEPVPLAAAAGRVLAQDLAATRTQPPADVSAMDGYAVRAADVAAAPARLRLAGEVPAGRPFAGSIGPGEAARIFTGGVLPPGTDTVVIQELATRDGETVIVEKPAGLGRNVRKAGLDFEAGEVLLSAGRRLNGRDIALAASMNHAVLPVRRRPRIGILATGDELVAPGTEPGPGQIVYSNVFALAALAEAEGASAVDLGVVPDRLDATIAAVRRARAAPVDVLVTAGGASVGEYDLVQQALAAEGLSLAFWKVALRPGKPLMSGRLGVMRVLGLPGNPVSAYVCAFLFLIPLIRRLSGRTDLAHPIESAILGRDVPANDERADYMRATLARDAHGRLVATPFGIQDSSMLVSLAKADCLLIREPYAVAAAAGSDCRIVRLVS
ncbi:MAG: molybdopterin molybdotransferase MoeA [Xanthobacteraceae bacterium]|nr:molybdopterin molybdotransferase MoeA [Xanthobacteraceae bacterium]PWB64813.1 MAG: molybdopterin molybdenumtransferase MoeA [Bradyrhizobiaceae bacterium]